VCGARGCLKAYVGGPDLAAEGSRRLGRPVDTAELFRLAADGEPAATAVVDEALEALAAGLTVIVNGLNPERLLLAGGIARALAPRAVELRERVARRAYAGALASTRLRFLRLDKRTTVRGGAALARHAATVPTRA
jgi:predicted NBD/HSP70 family sugar kinase